MKKIAIILAVAALAACTKSEVAYETPGEIGFNVVGGNITKAVVDGTTYPEALNMYVYAETTTNTTTTADYINNAEFTYVKDVNNIKVWGGGSSNTQAGRHPYYWPNVKKLHFAGYSKSGNVESITPTFSFGTTGSLSLKEYNPGEVTAKGANDLMWFPTTELTKEGGYSKNDPYVDVKMYHTCAWITFLVKGDEVTSNDASAYTVTSLTMTGIDKTANVTCSATTTTANGTTTVTPNIVWSGNTDKTGENTSYSVTVNNQGIALGTTAKNVETGVAYPTTGDTEGNIVVIPQVPGKLNLQYTYKSSTGTIITETVEGLDLALAKDNATTPATGPTAWEPGKHYIYTITIKANEILVAPTPVDWTDSNWNVTVE